MTEMGSCYQQHSILTKGQQAQQAEHEIYQFTGQIDFFIENIEFWYKLYRK